MVEITPAVLCAHVLVYADDQDPGIGLGDIDFVVCLGGDGTLLYLSSLFQVCASLLSNSNICQVQFMASSYLFVAAYCIALIEHFLLATKCILHSDCLLTSFSTVFCLPVCWMKCV